MCCCEQGSQKSTARLIASQPARRAARKQALKAALVSDSVVAVVAVVIHLSAATTGASFSPCPSSSSPLGNYYTNQTELTNPIVTVAR